MISSNYHVKPEWRYCVSTPFEHNPYIESSSSILLFGGCIGHLHESKISIALATVSLLFGFCAAAYSASPLEFNAEFAVEFAKHFFSADFASNFYRLLQFLVC